MNPPDVNPQNTEQLGLFVVAQLAPPDGMQVTLRTSPFGGTSAVVLIPRKLVVDDAPAALTSGGNQKLTAGAADPALSPFSMSGAGNGNGSGNANGTPAVAATPAVTVTVTATPTGTATPAASPVRQPRTAPVPTTRASTVRASTAQASTAQASTAQASMVPGRSVARLPLTARPAEYGTGSPPDLDMIQINRGFLSGTPRTGVRRPARHGPPGSPPPGTDRSADGTPMRSRS